MMKRSIIASSILGVKWAVLHPVEEKTVTEYNIEASIKKNFEYYTYAIDLARKNNVGIAFENMPETAVAKRRFTSHADELIALVDAFNDPMVGACWDFGHGNFLYRDQRIALRSLGSRLKATHVSDNYGTADDHMFPFHGNIDWPSIMPVLTEIGYRGDFTYEAFGEFFNLPDHIKDSVAKVAYQIGMYCLSLS
jgi:L-ribulose-5-phosphate 3-epimerase